jgi:hypothetical protein
MFVLGRAGPPRRQSETRHGAEQPILGSRADEFGWHRPLKSAELDVMKVDGVNWLAERQPFRPFSVRLVNGARYTFKKAREFGAPKDYDMIFFFGERQAVRIDTDKFPLLSRAALSGRRIRFSSRSAPLSSRGITGG